MKLSGVVHALIIGSIVAVMGFAQGEATVQTPAAAVEEAKAHTTGASQVGVQALQPPARPRPVLTPRRRGDIYMARKMYREAIETYQEGVKDAAIMYNKIGIAYHQLTDFKTALENYNMALRLNPAYAEAMNNIGTVYYAQRDFKKAIKQYQKALKVAPRSASIYSNLGTAHFARRKYKDAFKAYQQALQIDPQVFESRSTAGVLLQERNVKDRAKFHFYLSKTYASAGMTELALLYMRKALEEGFRDKDKFRKDPSFKNMQELEEFQGLLALEPRVL